MLRAAGRTALRTAVAALGASIPLALALAVLNGRWTLAYLPLVAAQLWVLMAIVLAAPLAIHDAAIAWRRRRGAAAHESYALAATAFFALAWVGRLKPSHQPFAVKAHLSATGAVELLLIAAGAAAIYAAGSMRAPNAWTRARRVALAVAVCSAMLAAFARTVEPRADRPGAARVAAGSSARAPILASRPRVLVLAVDGLDWAPIEYLSRRGQLPTLAGLVQRGRSYQIDPGGMAVSPPIWTAIYTGSASRRNMVGGYTEWEFAGLPHPIWFFPEFGAHPALMLDTLLDATQGLGLWQGVPTSTRNIQDQTIWEIASAAGRRVAVFDPAPFEVAGEHVNGRFVWRRNDRYVVEDGDGDESIERELVTAMPTSFASPSEMLSTERARVQVAEQMLDPDQDLAIYYTCVLDWLGHRQWDTVAALDASFERTPIAEGYRLVDAMAARLIARFGQPAVVVLLSDHGWEFSEYEHFLSPNGVLVVSGTGATGFGGTAHVLDIAPTVLSLLQLPIGDEMRAALNDVAPPSSVRRYARARRRRFVEAERWRDRDRIDLLRTLGYVAR